MTEANLFRDVISAASNWAKEKGVDIMSWYMNNSVPLETKIQYSLIGLLVFVVLFFMLNHYVKVSQDDAWNAIITFSFLGFIVVALVLLYFYLLTTGVIPDTF